MNDNSSRWRMRTAKVLFAVVLSIGVAGILPACSEKPSPPSAPLCRPKPLPAECAGATEATRVDVRPVLPASQIFAYLDNSQGMQGFRPCTAGIAGAATRRPINRATVCDKGQGLNAYDRVLTSLQNANGALATQHPDWIGGEPAYCAFGKDIHPCDSAASLTFTDLDSDIAGAICSARGATSGKDVVCTSKATDSAPSPGHPNTSAEEKTTATGTQEAADAKKARLAVIVTDGVQDVRGEREADRVSRELQTAVREHHGVWLAVYGAEYRAEHCFPVRLEDQPTEIEYELMATSARNGACPGHSADRSPCPDRTSSCKIWYCGVRPLLVIAIGPPDDYEAARRMVQTLAASFKDNGLEPVSSGTMPAAGIGGAFLEIHPGDQGLREHVVVDVQTQKSGQGLSSAKPPRKNQGACGTFSLTEVSCRGGGVIEVTAKTISDGVVPAVSGDSPPQPSSGVMPPLGTRVVRTATPWVPEDATREYCLDAEEGEKELSDAVSISGNDGDALLRVDCQRVVELVSYSRSKLGATLRAEARSMARILLGRRFEEHLEPLASTAEFASDLTARGFGFLIDEQNGVSSSRRVVAPDKIAYLRETVLGILEKTAVERASRVSKQSYGTALFSVTGHAK